MRVLFPRLLRWIVFAASVWARTSSRRTGLHESARAVMTDRIGLLDQELRVGLYRAALFVLSAIAVAFSLAMLAVWMSAAIIIFSWDGDHRTLAILLVGAGWLVVAASSIVWSRNLLKALGNLFPASRRLLREDWRRVLAARP